MHKYKILFLLIGPLLNNIILRSQEINSSENIYQQSYDYINGMLTDSIPLSFKDAVFITEDAYYGGSLDTQIIEERYSTLLRLINGLSKSELITYTGKDKGTVVKHAAIFKVLTDTILIPVDSMLIYEHTPYTYDFEDPLGQKDWSKMFVTKLLTSHTGQCHPSCTKYGLIR